MRKTAFILLTVLAVGACSEDPTSPTDGFALLDDAAELSFSSSFVTDPGSRFLAHLHRLPDNLKLTVAQEAQIKSLVEQFLAATRADHEALAAILKQAHEAARAGKSRDEVRAILEQGIPIRDRLQAAEAQLRTSVLAVLTPAQKAWLEAHQPRPCNAAPLGESQKAEISALISAFELANRADIDAIRAAFVEARTAHQNGASRDEIREILEAVRPAMQRVRAAEATLKIAILAVLTPEQRASGCHRFGR